MMTNAIIIASLILGAAGVVFSVWSLFDTRKKYYNEYLARKKK